MTGVQNPGRRAPRGKEASKTNSDNNLQTKISCSYQLIFLLESTSNCTKYIEIYKDAVNLNNVVGDNRTNSYNDAEDAIVIDRNQLVKSLGDGCTEKDETYRMLHDRAKIKLHSNGEIPVELMVRFVRQSIIVALKSLRHQWTVLDTEEQQPKMLNIILINFFDLTFIINFIIVEQKVDALIKLNCKTIAQVRHKFVSRKLKDERTVMDERIQRFWQNFHAELNNNPKVATVFKNVVVYSYESKYNAFYEPPDSEKIITMSRKYVMREMDRVQRFLANVKIEHEHFLNNTNSVYSLQSTNDDCTHLFESYNNHLSKVPDEVITVPVILDAMIEAISVPKNSRNHWVDICFDGLQNESEEGCMNYPVCVQYGNECGLTVKKHNLRFTNYLNSTAKVLHAKWKNVLWGSRPLVPLNIEAEYDRIIEEIKCQCAENTAGDDVDLQLCVLGLNRLRNNLDVFRGEIVDLSTLALTNRVAFQPKSFEPVCYATMLQILENESENFKRISHAYFEPEDVLLVIFYDSHGADASTRKRSSRITVPQWPIYIKDYFDYFYGKKKPKCYFATDATHPCSTYAEETEELRFGTDGQLTIAKRKWRFEKEYVSFVYKTKPYQIVRNVVVGDDVDDDDDRFIVYWRSSGTACYISKSRSNAIGCACRTVDGALTEIFSVNRPLLVRQSSPKSEQAVSSGQRETRRSYGNGYVVVEYADKKSVTHWASGSATLVDIPKTVSLRKTSFVASVARTPNGGGSSTMSASVKPASTLPAGDTPTKSVNSVKANKSRMKRVASVRKRNAEIADTSKNVKDDVAEVARRPYAAAEYSLNGTKKTLRYDDGTEISTYVQEVQRPEGLSDDWVFIAITRYEYVHPAYRTVTTDETNGAICVQGLVTRFRDGSLSLPVPGSSRNPAEEGRVHVSNDSVVAYGGGGRAIATFGWKCSESNLFEKRDVRGNVQMTVPASTYCPSSSGVNGESNFIGPARPNAQLAYYIVKRNMSGYRVLSTGEHDEFVEEMRGRADAVMVRETPEESVTVFDAGKTGDADRPTVAADTGTPAAGYEWLRVRVSDRATDRRTAVPKLMVSRTLRKANNCYGPVLNSLRNPLTWRPASTTTVRPARLVVRANLPRADAVCAMYATSTPARYSQERRRVPAGPPGPSLKRDRREQKELDAHEARMRSKRDDFLPYFQCDRYGPLRDYLTVNNLYFNTNITAGPRT